MDTVISAVSFSELAPRFATPAAPLLIDVRRAPVFDTATHLIAGATWRDPATVAAWEKFLPRHREVVAYCVHGHEISRNTAEALQAAGISARYLEGGIEGWQGAGGPLLRKDAAAGVPSPMNKPTRWITRERPKIDRIACPWLVRRFIDPFAEFLYVPADRVVAEAALRGAIPYDIPDVTYTHRGDRCSFDALVDDFDLQDAPLGDLAAIVRRADTGKPDLTPQSAGLLAASLGLSAIFPDDQEMLRHGMVHYDALYAWCRQQRAGAAERHNWNYPS